MMRRLLLTAPPMLGAIETFRPLLMGRGFEVTAPSIVQTMSEDELIAIISQFDAWIAGDCPVSRRVMQAGRAGRLRAIVKWGVGVDNVDLTTATFLKSAIRVPPSAMATACNRVVRQRISLTPAFITAPSTVIFWLAASLTVTVTSGSWRY